MEKPMLMVLYSNGEEGPHGIYWKPMSEYAEDLKASGDPVARAVMSMADEANVEAPSTIAESVRQTCDSLLRMQPFRPTKDITAIHVYRLDEVAMVTTDGSMDLTQDGSAWEVVEA